MKAAVIHQLREMELMSNGAMSTETMSTETMSTIYSLTTTSTFFWVQLKWAHGFGLWVGGHG